LSERVVERTFYSKCKELTFLVKAKPTFASFTIANQLLLLPLQYRAFTASTIAIAEAPFCSMPCIAKKVAIYTSWIDKFQQDGQDFRDFLIKLKQLPLVHFVRSH
jgi:hypothetical protein